MSLAIFIIWHNYATGQKPYEKLVPALRKQWNSRHVLLYRLFIEGVMSIGEEYVLLSTTLGKDMLEQRKTTPLDHTEAK